MKRNFFIDFDGTITEEDVVFAMVNNFCGSEWLEINDRWEKGEISTEECARQTFGLFKASKEELLALADTMTIDPYFPAFVQQCQRRGDKTVILSDGYDMMIQHILARENIDMEFYANQLIVHEDHLDIRCPYHNDSCGKCGTCKTTLLHRLKEKGAVVIYIGDGHSDHCVVKEADYVFAKEPLYRYCQENNIAAFLFDNFQDIMRQLDNLIEK